MLRPHFDRHASDPGGSGCGPAGRVDRLPAVFHSLGYDVSRAGAERTSATGIVPCRNQRHRAQSCKSAPPRATRSRRRILSVLWTPAGLRPIKLSRSLVGRRGLKTKLSDELHPDRRSFFPAPSPSDWTGWAAPCGA